MPRWYLEEKGIPYTWHQLAMETGEHREPDFLAINPFGKVPALVDSAFQSPAGGPLVLFESGAILLHLADCHGNEFTGSPQDAAAKRALAAQWILFANATLATALFVPSNREKEGARLLEELNNQLANGRSLLGGDLEGEQGGWSVADCAVHAYLAYIPVFFPAIDLGPYPHVQATIAATQQRPSYRRVMGLT
jgi:glutathione S-transferase